MTPAVRPLQRLRSIPRSRAKDLIQRLANKHQVAVWEIIGPNPRRSRPVMTARRAIVRQLAITFPGASYSEIGRVVGINHTSVLYALGRLKRQQGGPVKPLELVD